MSDLGEVSEGRRGCHPASACPCQDFSDWRSAIISTWHIAFYLIRCGVSMTKAKKKNITSSNEHTELLKQLHENFEQNRLAFEEFVHSNQHLTKFEKAEAWLKYVSENILDYSDQEAIVYLVSRGYDCSLQINNLISNWKIATTRRIKAALSAKYIYNVNTGKRKLDRKAITNFNKVSDFSTFNLPNFWFSHHDDEESIDATMLRTVEWCEIGGFDDWWIRLSQEIKKNILREGLENAISRSFWLFTMCRSDFAIKLMRGSLDIALETIKIPEYQEPFPWRIIRLDFENHKKGREKYVVGDVIPYAASIAFSHVRLHGKVQNNDIINEALEVIQKSQKLDGSWGFYSESKSIIVATAMALHAISILQPRGWKHSAQIACDWLWSKQNTSGYWEEEASLETVYLTVLVLDAIELANGGSRTTFSKDTIKVKKLSKPKTNKASAYQFKVALSFPGEVRGKVEEIAKGLARRVGKDKVFYDKFYEAKLARPNLDVYLQSIYYEKSRLVVLFLCKDYEKKEWCGLEWRAIRDLIKKRKDDSIMPLKLDDADISGLFSIDGYIDIRDRSTKEIVDLICLRIN